MTEPKPTYTPTAEVPTMTDEHLTFLRGFVGHTWISEYPAAMSVTEKMLTEVIAFIEDYRQAQGWL